MGRVMGHRVPDRREPLATSFEKRTGEVGLALHETKNSDRDRPAAVFGRYWACFGYAAWRVSPRPASKVFTASTANWIAGPDQRVMSSPYPAFTPA